METAKQETINYIKTLIEWKSPRQHMSGGQTCGMPLSDVTLICEQVSFEITIGYHRSMLKNKELAWNLFELYLDEVIVNAIL